MKQLTDGKASSSSLPSSSSSISTPAVRKRPDKLVIEPVAGPSTRLSGLMKRIQAKASDCQNQFESFARNVVSSAVHLKKSPVGGGSKQGAGVIIGPLTPTTPTKGPPPAPPPKPAKTSKSSPVAPLRKHYMFPGGGAPPDAEEKAAKPAYSIKVATLSPASLPSTLLRNFERGAQSGTLPSSTWSSRHCNNKARPDLSTLGFRPDKHVTCIEVTLVNSNQRNAPITPDPVAASKTTALPSSGSIRTYCFGEPPPGSAPPGAGDKSPSGTLSSRSSSRGSEQFDSGFEELTQLRKLDINAATRKSSSDSTSTSTPSPSATVMRSIWERLGEKAAERAEVRSKAPRVVQAKKSTVRREKAFRQRNKSAWTRAKEVEQRNNELLERFHQIRKRLGEEEGEEGQAGETSVAAKVVSASCTDLASPLPSIVKTLVRQYDTGQRSRVKIVPSRLQSKRACHGSGPIRPPRANDPLIDQVMKKVSLCVGKVWRDSLDAFFFSRGICTTCWLAV